MMRIIYLFPNFLTNYLTSSPIYSICYMRITEYTNSIIYIGGNHDVVQTLHNEISNLRSGFLPLIRSIVLTSQVLVYMLN